MTVTFSALQRAENSSIDVRVEEPQERLNFQCSSASRKFLNGIKVWARLRSMKLSVLFSEPKIPQYRRARPAVLAFASLSVLFSEPKIPQFGYRRLHPRTRRRFQCSSASRKFLNGHQEVRRQSIPPLSVLFSEPKIPQSVP